MAILVAAATSHFVAIQGSYIDQYDYNDTMNYDHYDDHYDHHYIDQYDYYYTNNTHGDYYDYDEEFQCDNGNVITASWECDNYDDCGDNSDEKNCTDNHYNDHYDNYDT